MPEPTPPSPRRATNVTLPKTLLGKARRLNVNVSNAGERGLAAEIADTRRRRWLDQKRQAIDAWNARVEDHGLPLADHRSF